MKTKILWITNLSLLAVVVFMGIEQAGMGAELAKMERDTHLVNENIHKISETILITSSSAKLDTSAVELGFVKPQSIIYIDSNDVLTSNLLR